MALLHAKIYNMAKRLEDNEEKIIMHQIFDIIPPFLVKLDTLMEDVKVQEL